MGRRGSRAYELPDPQLRAYDRGVATLSVDGEVRGHLASILTTEPHPRPWFVVVWPDGAKERPFGDEGPRWPIVRQLDAGRLEHAERGTRTERRFLGMRVVEVRPGPPCRYDVAWLPPADAARMWQRLGLATEDF